MLTTNPSDERWLAVLEGRAAPTDLAERQAAELRSYFEQRLLATPAADAQQEKRMMNLLRARGAFTEAPQPQGLLAALKAWWQAPQGRMGYGYSAAAVLAFALVSVPLLQQPPQDGLGDDSGQSQPQTQQPGPQPKGQPKSGPKLAPAGAVVIAADPAEASLRFQLLLSAQGVPSAIQPDGTGWRLTAQLPAEARGALEPEFRARNLGWPADGRLDLRFARQP